METINLIYKEVNMGVKFVIVFQMDGLDVEGMKEELNKICTVTELQEDILELSTGKVPVMLYYMDGTLAQFMRAKLRYNCKAALDNNYVLFPMAV